ncbi:MAG: T9SS type B sorting domain-containing protein, partial [Bacteroidota bacterium]
YTWTVTDNPDVEGESDSDAQGQDLSEPLVQTLDNTSNEAQLVTYTLIPHSIGAEDQNKCPGTPIEVDIWVEPTPVVNYTILRDTICDEATTHIELTTPTILTTGEVTFQYTSTTSGGITGNTSGISGLTNGHIIQDVLDNSTFAPQTVTYTITPQAPHTGCSDGGAEAAVITVHPTPDTWFEEVVDSVTCYGDADGQARIVAENGINEFTYAWDDPENQTSDLASGLAKGQYIVTITDNQGCTTQDTIQIKEPDELFTPADEVLDVTCFGYFDGAISISPIGGNNGYQYEWSTGSTNSSISGLNGGTYNVSVTDRKGCYKDTSIVVFEPSEIKIRIKSTDVICQGETNGTLEVVDPNTAQGYQWSNGETTKKIENLAPGWYTVTLTVGGCNASASKQVKDKPALTATLNKQDITCYGDGNGNIDLEVTGGNGDYTYSWSNGSSDEDLQDLSGGEYTVSITDKLGCSLVESTTIIEPDPFEANLNITQIRCFGEDNGAITANPSGGNGEYVYAWSNGESTASISDLTPGSYQLTLTDREACEVIEEVAIVEPDSLMADAQKTDISCYGANDGMAFVTSTGGNGGNSILWSNNQTQDTLYNLSPNSYSVTVTDARGCTAGDEVTIIEPEEILVTADITPVDCYGNATGAISLAINGGIDPFSYSWTHNPAMEDNEVTGLTSGNYGVTVTDHNGCTTEELYEVTQPDKLATDIASENSTCYGYDDAYIAVVPYGGSPRYRYQWNTGAQTPGIERLSPGNYRVTITDDNACSLDTAVAVTEPDPIRIQPTLEPSRCPDIKDGSIELNISGGNGYYNVFWEDPNLVGTEVYNIYSGTYAVMILDAKNCQLDTSVTLPSIVPMCFTIPTTFTPNNDGFNDVWRVDLKGLYPDAEIEVFDRWGRRVFYSKGSDSQDYWDGTFNGKDLPMDSYHYIIYLKNGMKRLSGVVTLVR